MILAILLAVVSTPKIEIWAVKSVTLNPASVIGGATVNGTVTISAAAGASGVTVGLSSSATSAADVPQKVTVPAGATSATFIIQTHPLAQSSNVNVQISAKGGVSPAATATLTVLPFTLTALTLNPATVAGGTNTTGTVTLSGPAPSAGIQVTVQAPSAKPLRPLHIAIVGLFADIRFPSTVTIPGGATSANFTIGTKQVSASRSYEIDATFGSSMKSATLTLMAPDLARLDVSPGSLTAGESTTGTVTLNAAALAGGTQINLKTEKAYGGTSGSFAQCGQLPAIPASVTVPAGSTTATFKVSTTPGYGVYWVEAQPINPADANFWEQSRAIDVSAPRPTIVAPSSVKGGTPVQAKLQLNGPAMSAPCSNHFVLASDKTNYAQVPQSVDVTPGATVATFNITTSAMAASAQPVTVTISATGMFPGGGAASPPSQTTVTATMTITP